MSKRTLFATFVALGWILIASETPYVAAQGPLAHGATYLDNQWHTLGPGATVWYAFGYAGDRTTVTLTLVNGVQLNMSFSVYAPDKPSDQPIGRGTSSLYNCNDGNKCPSPDLTWTGGSSSGGTYYVQVINSAAVAQNFRLTITNAGVSLNPSPSVAAPTTNYAPLYGAPYAPSYSPPYVAPNYVQPYGAPNYVPPYVQPNVPPYYPPGYIPPTAQYPRWPCCSAYYSPYYYSPQSYYR